MLAYLLTYLLTYLAKAAREVRVLLWPVTLSLPLSAGGSNAASDWRAGVACAPLSSAEMSAWSLTCREQAWPADV